MFPFHFWLVYNFLFVLDIVYLAWPLLLVGRGSSAPGKKFS